MTNATHTTPIDSDGKLCTHLPRCKQEIVSMIGVGYNPPFVTVKTEEPRGEITWETLRNGDYIICDGYKVKVLAVLEDVFLTSAWDDEARVAGWHLKKEAPKYRDWSIIQPTTTIREVTQKEVNEKFGEEVRIKG